MRIEIPENKKLVHESIIPLRWGDMDAYRHINNTVYFRYMEQARIEWIAAMGYSMDTTIEGMLMVNGFCNFIQQITYPGDLLVKTYVGNIGKSSVDVFNTMALTTEPEALCAAGGATMVWVDLQANKSMPWPKHVLDKLS